MTDPTDISEQERVDAEALRAALEGEPNAHDSELAEFAQLLRHYENPPKLSKDANDRLIDGALKTVHATSSNVAAFRRRAMIAAATTLAIAAGFAVFLLQNKPIRDDLAQQRSTAPLFHEAFPATGRTTERVDTIVAARERDLRGNQFARWGVAP
jgi:hypothetical protein